MSNVLRGLRRILVLVVVVGLLSATFARFAPGFDVDQDQLDARRSEDSLARLREARLSDGNVVQFYAKTLVGYLRGDLGFSRSMGQPVGDLLKSRLVPTAMAAGTGLAFAWLAGLLLSLIAVFRQNRFFDSGTAVFNGFLLCVPASVMALLLLLFLGSQGAFPAGIAIGLVLCPRIFQYARNLFQQGYTATHVLAARAKGLTGQRIFLGHVLPLAAPQLISLGGVSVSQALSAAIPMEMILNSPGIGQLAWQAALARDLSLLIMVTLVMSVAILLANMVSDLLVHHLSREQHS